MLKDNSLKKQKLLLVLCFFIYTIGYIGRYSYNANINLILGSFTDSHGEAGLVTTFFFFAYGIGQVVHGLLCKYYNKNFVFTFVLVCSGLINLLIYIGIPFMLVKWLWLVNGFLQAALWPSLINVLSESLSDSMLKSAIFFMSFCAPIGTLIIYGLSALFAWLNNFTLSFLFASISLFALGIVVFVLINPLLIKRDRKIEIIDEKENIAKKRKSGGFITMVVVLSIFAIVHNFVKDGLQTWVPSILNEMYGLPNSISIVLTLVLPFLVIFGSILAIWSNKKIKDFTILCGIFFLISLIFLILIVKFMSLVGWVLQLIFFGIVVFLMSAINNVIGNIAPLQLRDYVNAGAYAGIMNGFCYLGSASSSYGLGVIVDKSGWQVVFNLFFVLCVVCCVLSIFVAIISKIKKKKSVVLQENKDE